MCIQQNLYNPTFEKGEKISDLSTFYGVGHAAIYDIKKNQIF